MEEPKYVLVFYDHGKTTAEIKIYKIKHGYNLWEAVKCYNITNLDSLKLWTYVPCMQFIAQKHVCMNCGLSCQSFTPFQSYKLCQKLWLLSLF